MNETASEVSWRRRILSTSAFFALVAAACVNELTAPKPPTYSFVRILIQATGGDFDLDGYTVYVDAARPTQVGDSVIASIPVDAGTHEVRLANVAPNCAVAGPNPRTVNVGTSEIVDVPFAVVCVASGIAITVRTTGDDTPDVLRLSVNDTPTSFLGSNGSFTIGRLAAGSTTLTLIAPPHCTVAGGPRVDVVVVANAVQPVSFDVTCTAAVRAEKIAYHANVTTNGVTSPFIELVNVDGSGRVLSLDGNSPSWSPGRKKLVFSNTVCYNGWDYYYGVGCGGGLVVLDPETENTSIPAAGHWGFTPSWSPAGDAIVFTRFKGNPVDFLPIAAMQGEMELAVLQLSSGVASSIVIPGLVSAEAPAWSPDGRRIAFVCRWPSKTDLCVIGTDGTGLVQVTDDIPVEQHPAWSPNGSTIAFTRFPATDDGIGPAEIALLDLSTRRIVSIGYGSDPAWSPDGSRLVFAEPDGLFVMRADGTGRTRLTVGNHRAPAWRP